MFWAALTVAAMSACDSTPSEAIAFEPALRPTLPQVMTHGGPVLAAPKVLPIFFPDDPEATDIVAMLGELTRTDYWEQTTAEYGVGPLKVLAPIILDSPAPPTVTDDALQTLLAESTFGSTPSWGPPDPSTIYLFLAPQGTIVLDGEQTCCQNFGGYHEEANVNMVRVPYAVGCSCPAILSLGTTLVEERTSAISHELVEAATNPFPATTPAYSGTDLGSWAWTVVTSGEVGDLCALNLDANLIPAGATHAVQRTWSNAAARRLENPCVPHTSGVPYFNAIPVLGGTSKPFGSTAPVVPFGSSETIDVRLFSMGPTPGPWTVNAVSYQELYGGDPTAVGISLDRTTGSNGDVLHLTIAPHHLPQKGSGSALPIASSTSSNGTRVLFEPYVLVSQMGKPGDAAFQVNLQMGFVSAIGGSGPDAGGVDGRPGGSGPDAGVDDGAGDLDEPSTDPSLDASTPDATASCSDTLSTICSAGSPD